MRRKQLAILLGTAVLSAAAPAYLADETAGKAEATVEASADSTQAPEGTGTADASGESGEMQTDEPVVEEEAPAEIEEETSDGSEEAEDPDAPDSIDSKSRSDKKEEKTVDEDGLIVDLGIETSDSEDGDPETTLEEMWDDQMHNREFPGFAVDPSRYPPANITANTVILYRFLTKQMGLNHAAACGVLANIQLESNFRPIALGDSGTSYGICQWHNGRFTSLMNFCKARGLDYNTLEGQMKYLEWDLTHGYKHVYRELLKVKNSRYGAYLAGYLFCYNFEIPDQVEARSRRRGNLAMGEYYDKDFDQLEWEMKHNNVLIQGEDWLGLMNTQLSENTVVPEITQEAAAAPEDTAATGEEDAQALPEWQSALGEPSILL